MKLRTIMELSNYVLYVPCIMSHVWTGSTWFWSGSNLNVLSLKGWAYLGLGRLSHISFFCGITKAHLFSLPFWIYFWRVVRMARGLQAQLSNLGSSPRPPTEDNRIFQRWSLGYKAWDCDFRYSCINILVIFMFLGYEVNFIRVKRYKINMVDEIYYIISSY